MTFAEKEKIWKDFIRWGKGKYFTNLKDLGEKLGYTHRSWASKMIYDARDRRHAEFPEILWKIMLCASLFGDFEFPQETLDKPKAYPEQEGNEEWLIE